MGKNFSDIKYAEKLLDIYIQNATKILDSNFGVDCAENTMFEAIDLLRGYSELKPIFLKKVADTFALRTRDNFDYNTIPRDFIELCVHELRWPEFLELAKERVRVYFHDDRTLAAGDVSRSIQDAYSDEWMDRMYYKRYNEE